MSLDLVPDLPYVGKRRRPPEERPARPCTCGKCPDPVSGYCLPPTGGPRHARSRPTQPTWLPVPYRLLPDPYAHPTMGLEHDDDDQEHDHGQALAEVRPFRKVPRSRRSGFGTRSATSAPTSSETLVAPSD